MKEGGEEVVKDLAPLHNRLLVFWSDSRVPHEVLVSNSDRYALSFWYHAAERVQKEWQGKGGGDSEA